MDTSGDDAHPVVEIVITAGKEIRILKLETTSPAIESLEKPIIELLPGLHAIKSDLEVYLVVEFEVFWGPLREIVCA